MTIYLGKGYAVGYKQDLMSEHRAIERMLSIVDAMRLQFLREEPVPTSDFEDALEFIRVFADQCHHHKEENLLFPAMEAAGAQNGIDELLNEHAAGRAYVKQMAAAAASSQGDVLLPSDDVIKVMLSYTSLLREHITTEDTRTFPLADESLSDEVKDRLATEFDDYEREVLGGGKHEYFHEMIERMESAYGITVTA